jgi:hypothetical protein
MHTCMIWHSSWSPPGRMKGALNLPRASEPTGLPPLQAVNSPLSFPSLLLTCSLTTAGRMLSRALEAAVAAATPPLLLLLLAPWPFGGGGVMGPPGSMSPTSLNCSHSWAALRALKAGAACPALFLKTARAGSDEPPAAVKERPEGKKEREGRDQRQKGKRG